MHAQKRPLPQLARLSRALILAMFTLFSVVALVAGPSVSAIAAPDNLTCANVQARIDANQAAAAVHNANKPDPKDSAAVAAYNAEAERGNAELRQLVAFRKNCSVDQPTKDNPTPGYPKPAANPNKKGTVTSDQTNDKFERETTYGDGGSSLYGAMNGRAATGAKATLSPDMYRSGTDASGKINPPGWDKDNAWGSDGYTPTQFQRGHLLANVLGGLGGDARNLVTITQRANLEMSKIEYDMANRIALPGSGKIDYTVTPVYTNGYDDRPVKIVITAQGSGADGQWTIDNS
ncbi:DNA/RNA non-specific endonuclease [Nocardia sp. NPDC051570]|uniref:DNA/RNA non-specific endonuclease n=1 Tax=Nocardia sp. NPDC051570 TaxID=3364324 RepID=UPI0037A80645